MATVEVAVDVAVPVTAAYEQWSSFEEFPEFMSAVDEVQRRGGDRTHWVTRVDGVRREFDAVVTEQDPNCRITWRALDGPRQSGMVSFLPNGDDATHVVLQLDIEPTGVVERFGVGLGLLDRQVTRDLQRFKSYVESGA